ncbi:transposase [Sphingomonas sp. MMS24-JH45]
MKRKQFTEEQIIGILKEAEAGAVVTELCRKHGMSSATYYAWKATRSSAESTEATAVDRGGERTAQAAARGHDARQRGSEGSAVKKMVAPAAKRQAVAHLQATLGMSERRMLLSPGADRTSMRYRSCRSDDGDLRSRLCELAQQRRRFGYRRLHILLRRDGITINRKNRRSGCTARKV